MLTFLTLFVSLIMVLFLGVTSRIYLWLCVDRQRGEVIDFEVSSNRDFPTYLKFAMRVKRKYKVEISCSDHYEVYNKYHIGNKHVCSKAETSLVESFNSRIRHYLARFHRKTKRYSKAIDMISYSLILLFNKHMLKTIII